MTFRERYYSEITWHGKVTVMEIFHLAMSHNEKNWTLAQTAQSFGCSIGLVSENLKLAHAIHLDDKIIKCESRQIALKKLRR